jgi:hypothetical protein
MSDAQKLIEDLGGHRILGTSVTTEDGQLTAFDLLGNDGYALAVSVVDGALTVTTYQGWRLYDPWTARKDAAPP